MRTPNREISPMIRLLTENGMAIACTLLTNVKHHEMLWWQSTVSAATIHNHNVTNKNSRMKEPWITTGLQCVPFIILGMVTKCLTRCCMAGVVKHSVSSMYVDMSCLWIMHAAMTIPWSYTLWCLSFQIPLSGNWNEFTSFSCNLHVW